MVSVDQTSQKGFGYIGVLMLVMLLGWFGAAKFEDNQTRIKREKEQELLFILEAYHQALEAYYLASDDGVHVLPESIDQLLQDRRFIRTQRYLRKRYLDPMTGIVPTVIRNANKKIIGVYSNSTGWILNQAGFERLSQQKGQKLQATPTVYRDMKLIVDPVRLKKKLAQQKRVKNTSQ